MARRHTRSFGGRARDLALRRRTRPGRASRGRRRCPRQRRGRACSRS
jgi:hypothetical protein